MAESGESLRDLYDTADTQRKSLEHSVSRATSTFQASLDKVVHLYEQCLKIAVRISLFSPNESLEDISTADLKYLSLNYHLGELRMNRSGADRKSNILAARQNYVQFLQQLDSYDILGKPDSQLLETYIESPNTFAISSSRDPAIKRDQKIKRFKEEKALRETLAQLEKNPISAENDDETYRRLQLAQLSYYTFQSFQAIESVAQELHILSLAPPTQSMTDPNQQQDYRERSGRGDGYSEKLDPKHMSAGLKGPLLDSNGKPLRPFTLFGSKREELRNGVFRPDHSLPTMSIDEYLEEERKRGGIIDGGGPQSGIKPEVDEDDIEAADRATMKAREWDEYTEANPRGSGNTINRG